MPGKTRRIRTLTFVGLIVAQAAACTGGSGLSDRANQTWAERLTQQAGYVQQEQQRTERARDAWAQRMGAQARAYEQEQAQAQRASQAWSDRLTELARQYGSK